MANVVVTINGGVIDVEHVDDGIQAILKDYDWTSYDDTQEFDEDDGGKHALRTFGGEPLNCQVILTCRGGVVEVETCPEDIEVEIQDNDLEEDEEDDEDDEDNELREKLDNFMELYNELKTEIRRRDKHLYERWKAGGFCVDTDIISMYPAIEAVVDQLTGEGEEDE